MFPMPTARGKFENNGILMDRKLKVIAAIISVTQDNNYVAHCSLHITESLVDVMTLNKQLFVAITWG